MVENQCGIGCIELGDFDLGLSAMKKAIALNPNDKIMNLNYAIALSRKGASKDALAIYLPFFEKNATLSELYRPYVRDFARLAYKSYTENSDGQVSIERTASAIVLARSMNAWNEIEIKDDHLHELLKQQESGTAEIQKV